MGSLSISRYAMLFSRASAIDQILRGSISENGILFWISFVPPTLVAITWQPETSASITVVGNHSWKLGFTKIWKDGSISDRTSWILLWPRNSTLLSSSCIFTNSSKFLDHHQQFLISKESFLCIFSEKGKILQSAHRLTWDRPIDQHIQYEFLFLMVFYSKESDPFNDK